MYPGGYTIEVTTLSPKATEKDVYDFFVHCGKIEHVEIIRSGEYACTAFVTFRDAYSLETAVLLSGATILDQRVCINRWGAFIDETDSLDGATWRPEGGSILMVSHANPLASTPGEAVTKAQEVVTTMIAKGYVLGKDALAKAKAFDDSYQVSSSAVAKVVELSDRIGLTDRINAGKEVVKNIDEKFHVSEITKSAAVVTGTAAVVAVTATGQAAAAAANAIVSSSYFSRGALWVSDALSSAAKVASDFASHNSSK